MNIIELRKSKKITQDQASKIVGLSRRGYQYLEQRLNVNSRSYILAYKSLKDFNPIDEDHGILDFNFIKKTCKNIFDNYNIEYAYLFGSYAREEANELSDVDIFISTNEKGLSIFGLIENLRVSLHKKIDLVRSETIKDNGELIQNVLREGIKIYDAKER